MNRTAVLIEDNEQNRYLAAFLLKGRNYTVVTAKDGITGIEIAKITPADVILLDIQLPSMNGYEVARALRRIPALDHVPIVAVTSYAMVGDREAALEAGCNGYIEKPINPETFIDEIEAHIDKERPR